MENSTCHKARNAGPLNAQQTRAQRARSSFWKRWMSNMSSRMSTFISTRDADEDGVVTSRNSTISDRSEDENVGQCACALCHGGFTVQVESTESVGRLGTRSDEGRKVSMLSRRTALRGPARPLMAWLSGCRAVASLLKGILSVHKCTGLYLLKKEPITI
ncbi:hypothetical protein L227DRAFT_86044 [Lentinus tigrinus ALCF2SS1-6]|uniref:Uncharacterized protein n=1 Tax=Lentinus tigrinus ALCF2SS1-6 TaxID=1328759 RepID=A0A5C2SAJ1_9APHY|nr:hypothetical protein L227DRAFT_86044 [Lentinus tigrinus ALCF2SS1-6]